MSNKKMILMVVASFFVAWEMTRAYQSPDLLLFYNGLPPNLDYRMIAIWYFWFSCISFYFVGTIEEYITGYGKLLIVRNYNKFNLVIKRFQYILFNLSIIVLIQLGIFLMLNSFFYGYTAFLDIKVFVVVILLYFFTMYCLIILQILIEMFLQAQVAMLIVNMYVVGSLLIGSMLFEIKECLAIQYILIPNYAMAARTTINNNSSYALELEGILILLIVLILGIIMVTKEKMKIYDIF